VKIGRIAIGVAVAEIGIFAATFSVTHFSSEWFGVAVFINGLLLTGFGTAVVVVNVTK